MDENSKQTPLELPASGREIIVYEYGNSPKKVLLAHGWSGRGTQMSKIAKALVQNGYSTLSFDAPAHGKAPGKMSSMLYFSEAIHLMEEKYGPFEALVGHSLGGMASLRAIKEGLKVKRLVIIGTANSITAITINFVENLKMNKKVAERMKAYFDMKFGEDMDAHSGAVSAKNVSTPTLVIHDTEDVDVHVTSAYEIAEALDNSELYITTGLGHRRILGDQKVINKITTFIAV